MSVPNEFVPATSHTFHHEGVTSLVIQAAHSNSNFPSPLPNSNGGAAAFNGSGFFSSSLGYDVAMLPLFHHSSQRSAPYNATSFSQQKPLQTENTSRQEQSQIPTADGRSNVFHTETANCPSPVQSIYWSRQSQLSPFGVLPHEISPDLMDESKSSYENQLNAHFTNQSVANLNQMVDCDKKTQVIVSGKSKESNVKRQNQYVPKQLSDIKINSSGYHHDEMTFRNGVINHGGQTVVKTDQNKLMNSSYKNTKNELISPLQAADPVSTVPRDYRVFKSPTSYPNASSPVVKYTGKPTEPYVPKHMPDSKSPQPVGPVMKNTRLSTNGSPMIQQKISEFQEDSQSSPISLTSDDINEQQRYSSPANVSQNSMKELESESTFHSMNHMGSTVPQTNVSSVPVTSSYREHQLQTMNCHNVDENKVTPQFLKLPYTPTNIQNNVITETSHLNRKTPPFGPLYIMYNNPVNVPGHSAVQKPQEKIMNERLERQVPNQIHPQTNNIKSGNIPHTDSSAPNMMMAKTVQNGLIGYPSVIMRTDRSYDSEEKEKQRRGVPWVNTEPQAPPLQHPVKQDKLNNYRRNEGNQLQPSQPDNQHLLGLTERQHSYFDITPCTQIPPQGMSNTKVVPKNQTKNVYEDQQHQLHVPHSQSQEQMHHYQYMPANNKAQVPVAHSSVDVQPEITDKLYSRKRKTSKSNNQANAHVLDNSRVVMTPEYPTRDPPPAHVNLYPPQISNSNFMADGVRYDAPHTMTKLYPSNEQYYSPSNLNYNINPVTNVPHESHHHQTVISSHSTSSARVSPSNSQLRQVSPVTPSLPLSAYFSSFHPSLPSSHYPHHEYPANSSNLNTSQSFNVPEVSTSYPENPLNVETESRVKVIVPNVEEEFKFLFDPKLPHFKEISSFEEEELYKTPIGRQTFYRKNIDFLASYIKFLENNCESVETLTDSNSNTVKNWNRSKVAYQPVIKDKEENSVPGPPVSSEPPKAVTKEPECNFENDPRYYPLPKSSAERRLSDSSSDEEGEQAKKAKLTVNPKKPVVAESEKKKAVLIKKRQKNEPKPEKKKEIKREKKEPKKESKAEVSTVKSKLERLEKAKSRIEKLQKKNNSAEKVKPKIEKALAEIKAIKQSCTTGTPKKKPSRAAAKETSKSVPLRKGSERKAKDEVKSKIKGALDSEDELLTSSDSDPSWTPRDDEDENSSRRRSSRIRSVRVKTKLPKKTTEKSFKDNFSNNLISKDGDEREITELPVVPKNCRKSTAKLGQFYALKGESAAKHPVLWCRKNNKLQKFEQMNRNGKNLFSGGSELRKVSEVDLGKYQEIDVSVVELGKDRIVVELRDETDIPTDTKIKENFMKESLCYEHQFAVYIQTLVSQALDSNFLREIVKENDVYFLNNMKVIDDVTATYLSDLTSVIKWGGSSLDTLVRTWPFLSIKNIRESTKGGDNMCSSCKQANARQTAIFYGQPYLRETLQGCLSNPNIANNLEKTVDLCGGCARKIKLFNKIWHQKYHVFVECAKYVSKKKSESKNKGTTDILNELLADTSWLSKLFYDIRNTWLQIWTIVRKTKGS